MNPLEPVNAQVNKLFNNAVQLVSEKITPVYKMDKSDFDELHRDLTKCGWVLENLDEFKQKHGRVKYEGFYAQFTKNGNGMYIEVAPVDYIIPNLQEDKA